jgi:hypothetical protein
MVGCCEHNNGRLISIKSDEFLGLLSVLLASPEGLCCLELIVVYFTMGVEGVVRGLEGTHPADSCILTKLE